MMAYIIASSYPIRGGDSHIPYTHYLCTAQVVNMHMDNCVLMHIFLYVTQKNLCRIKFSPMGGRGCNPHRHNLQFHINSYSHWINNWVRSPRAHVYQHILDPIYSLTFPLGNFLKPNSAKKEEKKPTRCLTTRFFFLLFNALAGKNREKERKMSGAHGYKCFWSSIEKMVEKWLD